jgi:integrase
MTDKVEHEKRITNAQHSKFLISKNDVRYWSKRVFRPKIVRAGGKIDVAPNYAVQLQHARHRATLNLATVNQAEAASLARERYRYLIANGWEEFWEKYRDRKAGKPESVDDLNFGKVKTKLTVGEFLNAVATQTELSPGTVEGYAKRFRRIVSEVARIKGSKARFDYRTGGYQKWLAKVHAVPLAEVTPDKVRAWKRRFIDRAGTNELLRRQYTVSCNSLLRQARALFSKRNVLSKLNAGIELPAVLPFDDVSVERRTDCKFYGAGVEPNQLLRDAVAELSTDRPEEFKAFLLALVLGLRRKEADTLEWQSFDFGAGTVRIMPTRYYQLKTRESAAVLPVEPEIMALFRGWKATAKGPFVIESKRAPKNARYQRYRAQEVWGSLLGWLRAQGIQGNKPFHALRKLFGSAIADRHGLHVASSALRHADIRTTSEYYADRTVKVTSGFGSVLSGAAVEPFPAAAAAGSK